MRLLFTLILCLITSILITPLVKKVAYKIGAIDYPNPRKIHQNFMPRLGGIAIYISFLIGMFLLKPINPSSHCILLGSMFIIVTGLIDDIKGLTARSKLIGQLAAALTVVLVGGIEVNFINIPFGGKFYLGSLSIPFTIIWIVGITNSINLIDGLDGLAAGVSSIALISISGMAILMGNLYVSIVCAILIFSTTGFLFYNFYPAKIFMGDSGALFLGYMIAVLSLLGFKNVTFVSLIVPVIILGVPISDTFFAVIRRIIKKKPLSSPDKSHLHHCLLSVGFTHRQTVLIIYAMAAFFSLVAVIFSQARLWGSMLLVTVLIVIIEIFAEKIGLFGKEFHPLLKLIRNICFPAEKNR